MAYTTLIAAADFQPHLQDPDWVIVDCRYYLKESEQGLKEYREGHIPGALYAHLKHDLVGEIIPGQTGRHPLPTVEDFAETLANWGIDSTVQVVAYDGSDGSMAAARLWWLLKWLGHEAVAVLDGGWPQWVAAGYPSSREEATRTRRAFVPRVRPELALSVAEVEAIAEDPEYLIVDVRAPERYRGETEPIDPVAGHIPGAVNAPYTDNMAASGYFLSAEALRKQYERLLENRPADKAVFYCGSGVTSAHSILALAHAGLGDARLYAGSWSEWITNKDRPIETSIEANQAAEQ
jgi:thiosulfate/3-mercaptopyruvate sulfurtransferase